MAVNVQVKLKDGESQEKLIKRFRKQVVKEKIIDQVKENMRFTKKSDKKRLQKKRSKYYRQKEAERNADK